MNPKAYRLPKNTLPRRYDLELEARLDEDFTRGRVAIGLEVVEPSDTIVLHAVGLALSDARLTAGGRELDGTVELDAEREVATIRFAEAVPAGEARLEIAFTGRVSRGLEGLYRATDGPERLLCTQSFATAARTIFPCFDEPTFKARFAYSVTTDAGATVLANSSLLSVTEAEDGRSKTWTFEATKPMSSYLVALVIGDLEGTTQQEVRGVPTRVWALRGKQAMGEFAQGYIARLLPLYEDYFGLPYHFDKYDQVAVPGFAAGAMENCGLVVFRQGLLLMNPQTASWRQEKSIAHVVAHEFAHMWFGNLATIAWWDDVWLSEAFAEWFSYKAVDTLSPEYRLWDDFGASRMAALEKDALESTHPIYSPVETPAEALELFDNITYLKGCTVLRMLENYLGEDAFRAGLRSYMREFAESNATSADLWRNLQTASSEPVSRIVGGWILQPGYPIIAVALESEGAGTRLRLGQRRFYSGPGVSGSDAHWDVPLVIRYEDGAGIHEIRHLLSEQEASPPLPVSGSLLWCHANADEIGFYRQNPDDLLLCGLLDHLPRLSPAEQIGLLTDQWALVRNGSQRIGRFLDVLSGNMSPSRGDILSQSYSVLEQVVGYLHRLEDMLEDAGDAEAIRKFRAWVDSTFRDRLAALGFEGQAGEAQERSQKRVSVVDAMATLAQNADAIRAVRQAAGREAAAPASVDANLAPLFVAAAARFGDRADFDRYVEIYRERRAAGSSPQETNRYLNSFVSFRAPGLPKETLRLMDEKTIPQESVGPVLEQMLRLRYAQAPAWDYMKTHWGEMQALSGLWVDRLVEATGRLPAERRNELVGFYAVHLHGEAQQSLARALETMEQLAEFQARTRAELLEWFRGK
ncbi:MAG: M1 family metallopeptidase [Chloroflexia bacterium]